MTPQQAGKDYVWPNPATEMAKVARLFLNCCRSTGKPVLYGGETLGWFVYNGRRYVHHTDEEFEHYLYHFFGPQSYEKFDGRTKEAKTVSFNPDGTFLRRCRDSIRAQAHKMNLVHDSWLDDRKDRVVPLRNGLFDLDYGTFTEGHNPLFFNTYCLPFSYDPSATCARFDRMLMEIWPDDPGSRRRFVQYLGLILSGQTNVQKMLLMIGRPRSGKSVLAWLMEQLVSSEAMAPLTPRVLAERFGVSQMVGKKLGIFHDARDGGRGKDMVPTLLNLIGEDSVAAEFKHAKTPWVGKLDIRFVYVSNVPPALPDNTGAVKDRLLGLWFDHTIPEGLRDRHLKDKLAAELPGIFNRAIDAWRMCEKNGGRFADAPSADHLIDMVSAKGSPLRQWIDEECELRGSLDFTAWDYTWTSTEALYGSWRQWCDANGHLPGSSATFAAELRASISFIEHRRRKVGDRQMYGYAGIGLRQYEALTADLGEE